MRIGVDFDNTLVSYDDIFHRVALEQGAIPASLPRTKLAVRDHLRREGREEVWTEMQGTVYGARMDDVHAYPGALDFLKWARECGIEVCIISHKTRHPFLGPKHDLHAAAQRWVDRHVGQIQTFFELTKEEKLERIGACRCEHYIDDLPEILLARGFPKGVQRVLFDPDGHHSAVEEVTCMRSWPEIQAHFRSQWKK